MQVKLQQHINASYRLLAAGWCAVLSNCGGRVEAAILVLFLAAAACLLLASGLSSNRFRLGTESQFQSSTSACVMAGEVES